MKILFACEYSAIVRTEFEKKGHDCTSCDLLPTERPGKHYQGSVFDIINDGWDLMIAFTPCTYLSYAATAHWNNPGRAELREDGMKFFMAMINANIKHIAVENPVGYPNTVFRKPDQIIHPYYFGDSYKKRTCLWLKNLPKLIWSKEKNLFEDVTTAPEPKPIYVNKNGKAIHFTDAMGGGNQKARAKTRSKTFPGIAKAMANQWSILP